MRRILALFILVVAVVAFSNPCHARKNTDEFGFGIYNIGYYFPMLSENVDFKVGDYDVNSDFDAEADFIHSIQFTYGVTSRVFFQVSAAYYQGSLEINQEYYRASQERREWVTLSGDNNFKIMPISLGLGASFLKEGKFDPYAALGMTFFRIKVDKIDLEVDDVIVRDNVSNARIQSAEKDLRRDYIGNFVDRDYSTDLGVFLDLGMNYFFLDNLAFNTEVRYYVGKAGLYEIDNADFNVGGFAVTCGLKFVF
jgi:opacity protein-like surface antigen